jgi:gamma-glutamyltranspeptidase/glutathione hydrolase
MQLAFADRARYLGDPGFTTIPQKELLSDDYLARRRKAYFGEKATPGASIEPDPALVTTPRPRGSHESNDTTHLSLIDRDGNAIATTQSINGWMGAGQVIRGTGILLNNTMDDFSIASGVRNLYGAVGSDANRLQPGKTPLSSMTPTIAYTSDGVVRPELAIGAPGGTRIISCVAQTLLQHWIGGKNLHASVAAPRIHQQWSPDVLTLEDPAPMGRFSRDVEDALRARGHSVKRDEVHCRVMAASLTDAASDPRDFGSAVLGD